MTRFKIFKLTVCAAIFALAMGSSRASPVVLNFNQYAHDQIGHSVWTDVLFVGSSFFDQGFKIESCGFGYCGASGLGVFSRNHIFQPDQGQASVSFWDSNTVVLTRWDGSAFDFYSIDLAAQQFHMGVFAELSWGTGIGWAYVNASGADGMETVSFNDPGVNLRTVVFDVHDVTYVKLRTVTDRFQFDNIVLNKDAVAASIPEPGTYAMLFAGLCLLGFVARRRKLKEAATD